ncbi:hypothetical protein OAG71_04145 [bacterium]|nr:hypothetical protein [bacterium]
MKRLPHFAAAFAVVCFCFSTTGCDQPTSPDGSATINANTEDHGHDHDGESHEGHESEDTHAAGDDHGHVAPHGGQIIELGREHEYHAEIVDQHDSESITVYMLDGDLKDIKVDSETISITLISGEDSKTFEMTDAGQEGDEGSSFMTKDAAAFALMETENSEGKIRVRIDGKSYTGTFAHKH